MFDFALPSWTDFGSPRQPQKLWTHVLRQMVLKTVIKSLGWDPQLAAFWALVEPADSATATKV